MKPTQVLPTGKASPYRVPELCSTAEFASFSCNVFQSQYLTLFTQAYRRDKGLETHIFQSPGKQASRRLAHLQLQSESKLFLSVFSGAFWLLVGCVLFPWATKAVLRVPVIPGFFTWWKAAESCPSLVYLVSFKYTVKTASELLGFSLCKDRGAEDVDYKSLWGTYKLQVIHWKEITVACNGSKEISIPFSLWYWGTSVCMAVLIQCVLFSKVRTRQEKENKIRKPGKRVLCTDWLGNALVLQQSSYKPEACFISTKPEYLNQNFSLLPQSWLLSQ